MNDGQTVKREENRDFGFCSNTSHGNIQHFIGALNAAVRRDNGNSFPHFHALLYFGNLAEPRLLHTAFPTAHTTHQVPDVVIALTREKLASLRAAHTATTDDDRFASSIDLAESLWQLS